MTTQLQAVNSMLTSIGQAPITGLDTANPEIATSTLILDNVREEVLGEGWNFNSEKGYTLLADANGELVIPPGVLNMSVNQEDSYFRFRAIQRNGKLYDTLSHSFNWGANASVSLDIVWDVEFEDIPAVFQNYIVQRACRVFAGRTLGAEKMVQFNAMDEAMLRSACLAYECTTGRFNALVQGDKGKYFQPPTQSTLNIIAR
jgi:Tail tubular protein